MREISPPERKQMIKKVAQLGVLVFGVFTLATGLQAYDGLSRLTSPENVKTGAILDARDTSTHQLTKEQLDNYDNANTDFYNNSALSLGYLVLTWLIGRKLRTPQASDEPRKNT